MGKIYCRYNITNPTALILPNAVITGVFSIQSEEKKEEKLKSVEIQGVEQFEEEIEEENPQTHARHWVWQTRVNRLFTHVITKNDKIAPHETKEYPFELRMPSNWKIRIGPHLRDWHVMLQFCQKTGLETTPGANIEEATCILPVEGTQRAPSFY
jgi:FtsZ-binding cell division protein ZapB